MKKNFFLLLILSYVVVLTFTSCEKEPPIQKKNRAPVADAGAGQTIILPIDCVELNGTGIDADGSIVSYEWTKVAGPSQYTIVNNYDANAKVKDLVEGLYNLELKVTDDDGLSAKDNLIITVLSPASLPGDPCIGCWDY